MIFQNYLGVICLVLECSGGKKFILIGWGVMCSNPHRLGGEVDFFPVWVTMNCSWMVMLGGGGRASVPFAPKPLGMHGLVPLYKIHEVFIRHKFTSLLTSLTRRICKIKTHNIIYMETGQRSWVNEKFITLCPLWENSRFWSASAEFSKLQHWYSTKGPIPTLSCLKNSATKVLPSYFFY
jgi:hypothetical protein